MPRQLRRAAVCLNCGQLVDGNFCSACGQENTDYRVSLRRLLGDLADEVFQLESRLWRSLWDLVRHPGRLTREYNAGRRVRYTSPLRLYLLTSVLYFGLAAWFPARSSTFKVKTDSPPPARTEAKRARPESALERRLHDHLDALAKLGPEAASRRVQTILLTEMPKVVAVMVPLFALLTMAFFRRPRRWFVEHLVAALHGHAAGFLFGVVALPIRNGPAQALLFVGGTVWTVVFVRQVFDTSWLAAIVKTGLLLLIYGTLVACGLAAAIFFGLLYG